MIGFSWDIPKNFKTWLNNYELLRIETVIDLTKIKLLIIPGGKDIGIDKERDNFEIKIINIAEKLKIPILGICRGMQLINIINNGTLYEELKESQSDIHWTDTGDYKGKSSFHLVTYNEKLIKVNSRHHQGIDKVGDNLEIISVTPQGLIEGFKREKMLSIQWHPEHPEMNGEEGSNLILEWIKLF